MGETSGFLGVKYQCVENVVMPLVGVETLYMLLYVFQFDVQFYA